MNSLWSVKNPAIKVLDCTIRDGGLVNDHQFDLDFVKAIYQTNVEAGVEYMEIGYKNSDKIFSRDTNGAWKFCDEKDVIAAVGENPSSNTILSCMVDAAKSDWKTAVLPKDQSPLGMIRVAFYDYQVDEAVDMIQDAHDKGYEVGANLMAVTTLEEKTIDSVLERICKTPADVVVIVDSFGSLTPMQTEFLVKKYLEFAVPAGKEVGMHAHNNMQFALANTALAASLGVTRLDASIAGLGRGAGNCASELLLAMINPEKYNLRRIYQSLEEQMIPLRKKMEWGAYPEFGLTAINNVHPRSAIGWRKNSETKGKFVSLFDKLEAEN